MAEVKTTNAVNVIEVVQAGPRGPIWSGEFSGSGNFTGSLLVTGSLTVSGSGTLLNIGPFNNTGSIESSGSINVDGTGSFIHVSSSGDILGENVSASGDIHIHSDWPKLILNDVPNTNDNFIISANASHAYLDFSDGTGNTDLFVKSYTDPYNIVVDGGTGNVGIGSQVNDKTSKLYVVGNIEATTNITASAISSSGDIIANQLTGDTIGLHTGNVVGNVVGVSTGLTGTPNIAVTDIDATNISASGDILFDGTSGKIISNKGLDLRFHKEAGGEDFFKISNEITGKTLFTISELGLASFGTTGVDANLTAEENMTFWLDYPGNNSTGLKYTWKDYNTTLMELDQGGTLDVSGTISGSTIFATTLLTAETASIDHISRNGDTNTYIDLQADQFDFVAGGQRFARYDEQGGTDTITLGDTDAAYDIKLKNSTMTSISVDGSTGYVGINSLTPSEQLEVKGDITTLPVGLKKGSLDLNGHLKVNGDEIDFTDLPVGDPGVLGRLFVAESLEPGAARQLMVSGG